MSKKNSIFIAAVVALFAAIVFLKVGNIGTSLVWNLSNDGQWLLPLVGVAALIDSINPCAFSILLLTIAFLLNIGQERGRVLRIGGAYIFGLFVIYILIGLGILQALHIFNTPHFMAKVGAGMLLALGSLNLINHFFPSFPIKLRIPHAAHNKMAQLMEKGSIPAAFLLGNLVGLCEFPCTGGPYLMILGLLHDQANYLKGLVYLLIYNVIFVLPLALMLVLASQKSLLEKVREWKKKETGNMRLWGGLAMLALALLMFNL